MKNHPAYQYTPLAAGSQIRLIKLLPGAHHADIEVEIFTTNPKTPESEAATTDKPNDETEGPDAWGQLRPSQIPRRWSQRTRTLLERFWKMRFPKVKTASHSPDTSELKPLDSNGYEHKYDALSYTWGPNTNKVSILVKGKTVGDTRSFLVTRNLSIALRYLRDKESAKTLWIDALCINQADSEEKSRQVSMMTQIYKNANRVKIWLGPAADNSDMAMKELNNKSSTVGSITEENRQLRRSLESLARREYWTRVWVVQEIFVGSDVKIMCGTFEADWDSTAEAFKSFLNACNALLNVEKPSLPPSKPHLPPSEHRADGQLTFTIPTIANASAPTKELDFIHLTTIKYLDINRAFSVDMRGPDWLLEMLLHLRHFGATDPRDKIFSMLGLLPSEALLSGKGYDLRADYRRSFLEVSVQLFKYCFLAPRQPGELRKLGRLNIISSSQPNSTPEFPTWLPDFSKDNRMRPWFGIEGIGNHFQANLKISRNHRILSVSGLKVAHIVAATNSKDDCLANDDLSLLARLQQFVEVASQHLVYSKNMSRRFWRTLVLSNDVGSNLSDYLYKITGSFKQELSEFAFNLLLADESLGLNQSGSRSTPGISLTRAYLNVFRRQAYNRRFALFRTSVDPISWDEFGKVPAMVPQDGKVGDQLFRLGDCDYLVLLRQSAVNIKPFFNFVGPCHVKPKNSWFYSSENVKYIAIR